MPSVAKTSRTGALLLLALLALAGCGNKGSLVLPEQSSADDSAEQEQASGTDQPGSTAER